MKKLVESEILFKIKHLEKYKSVYKDELDDIHRYVASYNKFNKPEQSDQIKEFLSELIAKIDKTVSKIILDIESKIEYEKKEKVINRKYILEKNKREKEQKEKQIKREIEEENYLINNICSSEKINTINPSFLDSLKYENILLFAKIILAKFQKLNIENNSLAEIKEKIFKKEEQLREKEIKLQEKEFKFIEQYKKYKNKFQLL